MAPGTAAYAARAYADATAFRLNFLIEPEWRGELPRTLVIHADGRRAAASGRLRAAQLDRLLAAVAAEGG